MQGYNFTERVRRALARAREESVALNHPYIGTEHILLGLLADPESLAVVVLSNLDIDRWAVDDTVRTTIRRGDPKQMTSGPDLPYTSRAKKVLELAMAEARELNHTYVGTEHLLLGLIAETKGIAAQALVDAGVTLDGARREVLRVLGTDAGAASAATPPAGAKPVNIDLRLRYTNGATVTKQFTSVSDAVTFLNAQ
jgi:ATP-dependent Clp protease ATP-binding subunit ClpC